MKKLTGIDQKQSEVQTQANAIETEMAVDTLARTLWGEARGEGPRGMEAVANVVLNRLRQAKRKGGFWWGNTIIQICQKPYQFSCWNKDDVNFSKVIAVDARDLDFASAVRIARRAVLGALPDRTDGATHYHAAGNTPYWAKNNMPVAVIGRHIFYRLES